MIDGRGKHMKKVKSMNFEAVKKFFENNPGAMLMDCQRETGLSAVTVRRHVKKIKTRKKSKSAI